MTTVGLLGVPVDMNSAACSSEPWPSQQAHTGAYADNDHARICLCVKKPGRLVWQLYVPLALWNEQAFCSAGLGPSSSAVTVISRLRQD